MTSSTTNKIFEASFKAVVAILLTFTAYEGTNVLDAIKDHERRLTVTEATTYTKVEAIADYRGLSAKIDDISTMLVAGPTPAAKLAISQLREDFQQVSDNLVELKLEYAKREPPAWTKDQITKLNSDVAETRRVLSEVRDLVLKNTNYASPIGPMP